ncbi:hypothetical protein PR001_g29471, partial [Phytophthora rubi]
MVNLYCGIADVAGSPFPVGIDEGLSVGHLKEAIKDKNSATITCDAKDLKLFLAKKDGRWLTEADVMKGVSTIGLEELGAGAPLNLVGLSEKQVKFEVTLKHVQDKTTPVHVLAEVPGKGIDVGQDVEGDNIYTRELRLYQQRGNLIKVQHADYCGQILDKIDQLYEDESRTLPFICVEGSSGMGKTQLAFALGGRRPWFYWPATRIGSDSQNLYQNFDKISDAFDE